MLYIKGSVSRDLLPLVFSWFKPIWASDKYFPILFRFRRDIRIFKKLCGVHHMQSQAPRCASHCMGVKLRGVLLTAWESSSAMCITPQSQVLKISQETPGCASYRKVKLLTLQCQNRNILWSLVTLKGKIRWNPFMREHIKHIYCIISYHRFFEFRRGFSHFFDSMVSCTPRNQNCSEFFFEFAQ